jgi:carboxymethylenebutenolidase
MCDENTVEETDAYLKSSAGISRRRFGTWTAAAAAAAMLPGTANALEVTGNDVKVTTPDGIADCYFVHPATGSHPGVIVWPDILGL